MIDTRSLILGFLIASISKEKETIRPDLERLCKLVNMTPPTEDEGVKIGQILIFVGDLMQKKLK